MHARKQCMHAESTSLSVFPTITRQETNIILEFMEAWQKERSAKESRDELARALEHAEKDRSHLETESARHEKAQSALDALYQSIFAGPTPDVPGEDQMENTVQQARTFFDQCQTQVGNEKKALEALQKAQNGMQLAYRDIGDALRRSSRDMWGGGTFTDMMEREALSLVSCTLGWYVGLTS